MVEESHIIVKIGEEGLITNPGFQLGISFKVGNDCFPALKQKLTDHGLTETEDIIIAIVKTFNTSDDADKVKTFLESSPLIPEMFKPFIGKIVKNGNKLIVPIILSSLGMMPSIMVQGFVAKFSFITDLPQELQFSIRIAPTLINLFNSLKEGKVSCLNGSFLKFIAKLHSNMNKALYDFLKSKEKFLQLLGYVALLFKSLKIDLAFDPSNDEEFSALMTSLGVPTEMIGMVPSMLSPMIEGLGIKDLLSLLDGNLSIVLGVNKAVAEISIDINGLKDLLSLV
jgi:hypothetical protein